MKKVLIAFSIVACATIVNASSWKWGAAGLQNGKSGTMTSGTAYIFDADIVSQSSLYNSVLDGSWTSKAISSENATRTVDSGVINPMAVDAFEYGSAGSYYNFYFVILDSANNQVYFSNIKENQVAKSGSQVQTMAFGSQDGSATFATASGFQGAGAWSQTVPEPFSGALALVGLGVIGLRRKLKGKKQEKMA